MMLKKGDLLNVVGGVILAVVCLLVVFGFAVKLYNLRTNQEDENAKKTLDLLMSKIELLQDGQATNVTLQGFDGFQNWFIVGWNKSVDTRSKPQKCFFESCICVCNGAPSFGDFPNYPFAKCQESGFCREIHSSLIVDGGTFHYFDYDDSTSQKKDESYSRINSFPLSSRLFEVSISRLGSEITVADPKRRVIDYPAKGTIGRVPAGSQSSDI